MGKWLNDSYLPQEGGCSSAGRAGQLVIGRSLVQIPALGRAELHVEVSLSKILNPTLLTSEGPAMNWRLIQGVPCPCPETRLGLAPAATPRNPMERDKRFRQWHDMTYHRFVSVQLVMAVMVGLSCLCVPRHLEADVRCAGPSSVLPKYHRWSIFIRCIFKYANWWLFRTFSSKNWDRVDVDKLQVWRSVIYLLSHTNMLTT